MASMKPSKATAHPSPSPSRIMGPPPPRRVVASPSPQRSPKATARAEPSRSAPPPQDRTYIREKASSKPSSKDTERPPRSVHPSHETATNKPSKSATPRPLPFDPNLFMAGKLAHEYLTKGTLFGQPYVPTEADFPPAPVSPSSADVGSRKELSETDDKVKKKENGTGKGKGKAIEIEPKPNSKSSAPEQQPASNVRYANVSKKLMTRGMYIPGIVNPSELSDFLNRHREIE